MAFKQTFNVKRIVRKEIIFEGIIFIAVLSILTVYCIYKMDLAGTFTVSFIRSLIISILIFLKENCALSNQKEN
jgi:hypothetical protein